MIQVKTFKHTAHTALSVLASAAAVPQRSGTSGPRMAHGERRDTWQVTAEEWAF